ncbi:MAG: glycosyltransferase family 2 protein [Chloroflexi bacterium]|nr:glycosyltransferase family 2 protein [Chloroflexota bacterium]
MKLGVVIVSFQTPGLTRAATLSAITSGADTTIVVDNASLDETVPMISTQAHPSLLVIEESTNRGFGAAANVGAKAVPHEAVIFLNSDAELESSGVEALLAELQQCGGRAIVAPRLADPAGAIQHSAGLLPRPGDLLVRALNLHRIGLWATRQRVIERVVRQGPYAADYYRAVSAVDTIDTNMVSGACFAIGREAFWELGGFDERFFMYFEDADLCKRAAAAGMPIRYVPSAVVTHIGGASSEGDYHFSPMHARSMRQYLEKWWGSPGAALAILLLWLRLIGHALVLHPGTGKAFAALRAALRP